MIPLKVGIDSLNELIKRKEAAKHKIEDNLRKAETSPREVNRSQKEYLAQRVRDALVTAAAQDPINDFSNCSCTHHNIGVEVGDTLTASVIWRPTNPELNLPQGVSVTNFTLFNAQRRDALLASVYPPSTSEGRRPLEERLLEAVSTWLDSPDHSPESWRQTLRAVLGPALDLETRQHAKQLSWIFKTSDQDREDAITQAIEATEDLRLRLLAAENDRDQEDSLQAAGKWKISSLLTSAHQKLVAASILQHAKDTFQYATFKAKRLEPGYDGARRFVAGDPEGRHGAIHLQVDETGEGWSLPERTIGNKKLPATKVLFPGDNPQNPGEWSNSKSRVQYRHRTRTGRVSWHEVT